MKSSELKQLIKEEIVSILSEDVKYKSFKKGEKVKSGDFEGEIVGNEARRGVLLYKIKDSKGNIKSFPSTNIDKISNLNESDISTYEQRDEEAKDFADKNFKSVSFMGYGFNELAPESFKGEFKIRSGEDFDEAMKIISKKYKVDTYNSERKYEKEFGGDRDYLPTIKITGIK